MSAIQSQNSMNTPSEYGICNIETWKETAKNIAMTVVDIALTIAIIAAVVIPPVASYWASGTIACVAVVSLEIVCLTVYALLTSCAQRTAEVANVLGQGVGVAAGIAGNAGNDGVPLASWR